MGIEVRRVAQNALDGVAGGLRHQGAVARYAAAKTWDEDELEGLVEAAAGQGAGAGARRRAGSAQPRRLPAQRGGGGGDRGGDPEGQGGAGQRDRAQDVGRRGRQHSRSFRVTNLARCLRDLQQLGVWIYGLAGEAEASLYSIDLSGNVALVLGGEADGMRRLTREHCDQLVKIPMPGEIESLNVSVAAGVTLFEAVRQRL